MWLNYFDAWFRCFCLNQIWVIPSGPCLTSCLKDLTFPMLVDTSHYVGSRYMNCFLFVEQFCTFTCGLLRDWLPRMPCECHFISPRSKENVCAPSMSPYLTLSCRIWLFTTIFFIWNNMIVCDDKRWIKNPWTRTSQIYTFDTPVRTLPCLIFKLYWSSQWFYNLSITWNGIGCLFEH